MASVMLHEEEGDLESKMALTAAVMADKSRSRMLCALMDGRAWTATELSLMAEVSASTASSHLARLQQHFGLFHPGQLGQHAGKGGHTFLAAHAADGDGCCCHGILT